MKGKIFKTIATMLFSLSTTMVVAETGTLDSFGIIPKESAVKFGEYVESRPKEEFIFETSTRMIDFDKKLMWIMDVSEVTPMDVFDQTSFVEVKEFIADFSGIPLIEGLFDEKSYPEKRISDECSLKIEEYGLFIQGRFIDKNTFKVLKLKPKKIMENNLTGYCRNRVEESSEQREFQEIDDSSYEGLKEEDVVF